MSAPYEVGAPRATAVARYPVSGSTPRNKNPLCDNHHRCDNETNQCIIKFPHYKGNNMNTINNTIWAGAKKWSRRDWLAGAGGALGAAIVPIYAARAADSVVSSPSMPPDEAIAKLMAGNRRFVSGAAQSRPMPPGAVRPQFPFAVVVGCSDSRAPIEIIFDQGIGDLFIIRTAGNTITPTQLGSIEYAVANLQTPLVVVMGHSRCGAVTATVESLRAKTPLPTAGLQAIADTIAPAVSPLLSDAADSEDALLHRAIHANIDHVVAQLPAVSPTLAAAVAADNLKIIGAHYDIATSQVTLV